MQRYPLEIKIRLTQDRIRGFYNEFGGNVYVSRSGGKDSDVLGHIVKGMYPDVPHVFVDTGLEWTSVQKHGDGACNAPPIAAKKRDRIFQGNL